MNIIISNSSSVPIYEQVYTQIKNSLIRGEIDEGEMLPSIRSLAKDLRISVITTKRAYEELERDGFIYTVAGKGCFAAERNNELIKEERLCEIEELIKKAFDLAAPCGITKDEIFEMIDIIFKED